MAATRERTDGDNAVVLLVDGIGQEKLELANLVAGRHQSGLVVPLDPHLHTIFNKRVKKMYIIL
jgi:hypothetical protein